MLLSDQMQQDKPWFNPGRTCEQCKVKKWLVGQDPRAKKE